MSMYPCDRYNSDNTFQCSYSYYHIVIIKSSQVKSNHVDSILLFLPSHLFLSISYSPPRLTPPRCSPFTPHILHSHLSHRHSHTTLLDHPIPQFLNHGRFPLYPTLFIDKCRRPTCFPTNHQIFEIRQNRPNRWSRKSFDSIHS